MKQSKNYILLKEIFNKFLTSKSIPLVLFRIICCIVIWWGMIRIVSFLMQCFSGIVFYLICLVLGSISFLVEFTLIKSVLLVSINRLKIAFFVAIAVFLTLVSCCGFKFIPFVFDHDFFSHYKFVVWCNIMLLLLSLSLAYNIYQTQKIYKFLSNNTFFKDKDENKEITNQIAHSLFMNPQSYIIMMIFFFHMSIIPIMMGQNPSNNYDEIMVDKFSFSFFEIYFFYVYILIITFVCIKPNSLLESFLEKSPIDYKFKYSDSYCGLGPILKYLNSSLLFGVNLISYIILLLYTFFFESNFINNIKNTSLSNTDPVITYGSLLFMLFISFSALLRNGFFQSVKAYFNIKKSFENEKKKYLEDLEKKDDIESLLTFQIVKEKKIFSPMDKITLPAKLLVTPTFITYLRGKILSTDDIDLFLNSLFN